MKKLYGVNSDCVVGQSELITLELIKKIGFTSFFTDECNDKKVKELKSKADALGLVFEFIHAPFKGINAIWEEGDRYLEVYNGIIEAIDSASNNDVPAIIIHTSSGWNPPEINQTGIKRYDALLEYAKEKGVILAFENLRSYKHVECFVERYKNEDSVRFCYDFGHQNCYTPKDDFISIFGDKTIYTHIHDNHGFTGYDSDGDEHLLPFDGTCDFKEMVNGLYANGFKGSLMLEVFNSSREDYLKLTPEEFLSLSFERVKKL